MPRTKNVCTRQRGKRASCFEKDADLSGHVALFARLALYHAASHVLVRRGRQSTEAASRPFLRGHSYPRCPSNLGGEMGYESGAEASHYSFARNSRRYTVLWCSLSRPVTAVAANYGSMFLKKRSLLQSLTTKGPPDAKREGKLANTTLCEACLTTNRLSRDARRDVESASRAKSHQRLRRWAADPAPFRPPMRN